MAQGQKSWKLSRLEVFVVLGTVLLAFAVVIPGLRKVRGDGDRTVCASNLAAIGKAIAAYAADSNGRFPRSGGPGCVWGWPVEWRASRRPIAFRTAADGSGGWATVSSSLYLLVKGSYATPESFVCPGDKGATEFLLAEETLPYADFRLADAWDFGSEPSRHCSYAYQFPFGPFGLTKNSDPRMAVAADRSPWFLRPGDPSAKPIPFKPDIPPFNGTTKEALAGNATQHGGEGQNVLFVDGHVDFKERAFCGLDHDNIYTLSSVPNAGDPLGVASFADKPASPANLRDSFLVQDGVAYQVAQAKPAPMINSTDLKRTTVVATLDSPLPEHRNAVWCATLQIAWDHLKQDVIRQPVQVLGAETLADRLNQGQFRAADIAPESYYATAGFVKDGIIERIQKEMAERFPLEPVPQFDKAYRTLPKVIVAYAYLSVNVSFEHPYYTSTRPFAFTDSNGVPTDVTSFDTSPTVADDNLKKVREQVEILSCRFDAKDDMVGFAVDLCKNTQPYQVVLAVVPRAGTLAEALAATQKDIADFKDDPYYGELRNLRPIDGIRAPDISCKLRHSFSELLGKYLGNAGFTDESFFEALQMIDFNLSRTGVILKSEMRTGAAAGRPARVDKPRNFWFDKPFLIYVKKRQAEANPFFVMWVDNAELMTAFATK